MAAFIVTVLLNVPIVFTSVIASDKRQLAFPLVFILPVAGRWLLRLLAEGILGTLWKRKAILLVTLAVGSIPLLIYVPAYLTKLYQAYAAACFAGWFVLARYGGKTGVGFRDMNGAGQT